MRVLLSGKAPAFQAGHVGSIPITRFFGHSSLGNSRQGRVWGFVLSASEKRKSGSRGLKMTANRYLIPLIGQEG